MDGERFTNEFLNKIMKELDLDIRFQLNNESLWSVVLVCQVYQLQTHSLGKLDAINVYEQNFGTEFQSCVKMTAKCTIAYQ